MYVMHKNGPACRIAGASFIMAFAALIFSNAASFAIYPHFNPESQYFSDFGAMPNTSLIWNSGMLAFGTLIIVGAIMLSYYSQKNVIAAAACIAAGVGFSIVALFPETTSLSMHTFGALLGFAAGGIFTMLSRKLAVKMRRTAIFLGTISLLSTFLLLISGKSLPGIIEIMIVGPFALWLLVAGIQLAHALPTQKAL